MGLEFADPDATVNHICIDIETLGSIPYQHHMVQLSACAFDLSSGTVHPLTFDRCLTPMVNVLGSDPATMQWWYRDPQRLQVLNSIKTRGEDPKAVMLAFQHWILQTCGGKQKPYVWVQGSGFDWLFVEAYFKILNVLNPLDFYMVREIKSYIAGASGALEPRCLNYKPFRDKGLKHNALADVLYQVEFLIDQHRKRDKHPKELATLVFNKRTWEYTDPNIDLDSLDPIASNGAYDPNNLAEDIEREFQQHANVHHNELDDDLPF